MFYWSPNGFAAVSLRVDGDGVSRGTPEVLFASEAYVDNDLGRTHDVSPDGDRFLMVMLPTTNLADSAQIVCVQNWHQELKRLVPVD